MHVVFFLQFNKGQHVHLQFCWVSLCFCMFFIFIFGRRLLIGWFADPVSNFVYFSDLRFCLDDVVFRFHNLFRFFNNRVKIISLIFSAQHASSELLF